MFCRHRWKYWYSSTHRDAYGPLEHRECVKCGKYQTLDTSPLFGGWK